MTKSVNNAATIMAKAANMPRSCIAGALTDNRHKNADAVVTQLIITGVAISRRTVLTSPVFR